MRASNVIHASDPHDSSRAAHVVTLGGFTFSSERDGDVHTLSLSGELDLASADTLQSELERVEAGDARSIVLDLSGLTFMDSTGVRLLVSAHARSRADGDRLTIRRGPHAIQRVLDLTGVADLLPFAD